MAGAPFPEGAVLLEWPKPVRCPAGRKNRQGSGADDRLPGPGRAFRCGQSAWGSFRPALAGSLPQGGGAPEAVKTGLLPGKMGEPTGDVRQTQRGMTGFWDRPVSRTTSAMNAAGEGQGPPKKEGVAGRPSTAPRSKWRGVLGAPLPMRQRVSDRCRPVQGWRNPPPLQGKNPEKGDNLLYLQNIIQIVFKSPQKKPASTPTVSQRGGGAAFLSAVYRERGNIF